MLSKNNLHLYVRQREEIESTLTNYILLQIPCALHLGLDPFT